MCLKVIFILSTKLKIYYMIDAAENQDTALIKNVVTLHQDV